MNILTESKMTDKCWIWVSILLAIVGPSKSLSRSLRFRRAGDEPYAIEENFPVAERVGRDGRLMKSGNKASLNPDPIELEKFERSPNRHRKPSIDKFVIDDNSPSGDAVHRGSKNKGGRGHEISPKGEEVKNDMQTQQQYSDYDYGEAPNSGDSSSSKKTLTKKDVETMIDLMTSLSKLFEGTLGKESAVHSSKDGKGAKDSKDSKDKDSDNKDSKGKDSKDKDSKDSKDSKDNDSKDKDSKDSKDSKGKDSKDSKGKDSNPKGARVAMDYEYDTELQGRANVFRGARPAKKPRHSPIS